jgi:hypothetical protein
MPLRELLATGGKVIALIDDDLATEQSNQQEPYTFVYRDWYSSRPESGQLNVFDVYADTASYDEMRGDQIWKFLSYNGRMEKNPASECDLFLLNWCVTTGTNDRHWIPDEATFEAMGYSWGNIRQLSDNELNAIPERAPFPAVAR